MKKILSFLCIALVAMVALVGCKTKYELTIGTADQTITLEVGDEKLVTPTVTEGATLVWESSAESVVTVANGLIEAVGVGTATVTVYVDQDQDAKATISVTVNAIKVANIAVAGATTMVEGSQQTLTATVTPTNATNKEVTWTTSDATVATVSATGVVNALKVGTVTITATANDGSNVSRAFAITVNSNIVLATSIEITGKEKMDVGSEQTLTATVAPTTATDKTVAWSSSDETIATVSAAGVVNGLKLGTVTITATANDGSNVKATFSITVDIAEGTIEQLETPVVVGQFNDFSTTANPFVASEGKLTADLRFRTDTNTVILVALSRTYTNGAWAPSDLYALDGTKLESYGDAKVYYGGTYSLSYATDTHVTTVTETIAPIDPTDFVLVINGKEYNDGDTIDVTEFDVIEFSIKYLPTDRPVREGIDPSIFNTSFAEIKDGKIEILKPGTVALQIAAVNAIIDKAYILNIAEKHFPPETITVTVNASYVEVGDTINASATVAPERASQEVTWSVADETIAKIDAATGVITGVAVGKVKIYATSTEVNTVVGEYEVEVKEATVVNTDVVVVDATYVDKYASVTFNEGTYVIGKNAFATVEDAIDVVSNNGTIYVAAGEYTLSRGIVLSKSVKFIGPNADKLYTEERVAEAQIKATSDNLFDFAAQNISFNGLHFSSSGSKFFRYLAGSGNITFKSNYIYATNSFTRQDNPNLAVYGYIHFLDNTFENCSQFGLWLRTGSCANLTEVKIEGNYIKGGGTVGGYTQYNSAFFRLQDAENLQFKLYFRNNLVEGFGNAASGATDPQPVLGFRTIEADVRFNTFIDVPYPVNPYGSLAKTLLDYNLFLDAESNVLDIAAVKANEALVTKDESGNVILEKAYITALCTSAEDLQAKYAQFLAGTLEEFARPSVTLNDDYERIIIGETYDIPFTASEGATVTWTSSDAEVATVDANGKVTPVAVGNVTITATVEQIFTASMNISVALTHSSTIAEVAALADDAEATVSGIVYYVADAGFVIRDATNNGIYITSTEEVAVGDLVYVTGKKGTDHALAIMSEATSVEIASSNNAIAEPVYKTAAEYNALTNTQANVGLLVRVNGEFIQSEDYINFKLLDDSVAYMTINEADVEKAQALIGLKISTDVVIRYKSGSFPSQAYPVLNIAAYATVYVDPAKDETEQSFKTFAAALEAVANDGTLVVAAGTYEGDYTIGKKITLLGANSGVHPSGTRAAESIFTGTLALRGADTTVDGIQLSGAGRINLVNNRITIKNCNNTDPDSTVLVGPSGLVYLSAAISDLTIDSCVFVAKGSRCIYLTGSTVTNATFTNNVLQQTTTTTACDLIRYEYLAGEVVIKNNEFKECGQYALFLGLRANTANILIENNTFNVAGATCGISVRRISTGNVSIIHNSFSNIAASLVMDIRTDSGVTAAVNVHYNTFTDTGKSYLENDNSTTGAVENVDANYNYFADTLTATNFFGTLPTTTYATVEEVEAAYISYKYPYSLPLEGKYVDVDADTSAAVAVKPEGWTDTTDAKVYANKYGKFSNNGQYILSPQFAPATSVDVTLTHYINNTEDGTTMLQFDALDADGNVVATFTTENLSGAGTTTGVANVRDLKVTLTGSTEIYQIKITMLKSSGGNIGFSTVKVESTPTPAA